MAWFLGEPYWTVWSQRLFSNILAQLTIVPGVSGRCDWLAAVGADAVVDAGCRGGSRRGRPSGHGVCGFWRAAVASFHRFAPCRARRRWRCSFRFCSGPPSGSARAGAGVTLFTATILAVWSVVHGQGPFAEMSPTTTVPALTLSLIVVAATVLSLAALVEERRQTQSALAERLGFEELLARLSGAFVQVPSDRMDAGFDQWLGRIGAFLDIKCVRLYTLSERDHRSQRSLRMDPPRLSTSSPRRMSTRDFPWSLSRLQQSLSVVVSSVRRPAARGG